MIGLMTVTSLAGFLLLPSDWMPAHRYASAFIFDGILFCVSLVFGGLLSPTTRFSGPWKVAGCVVPILTLTLLNIPRTMAFRQDPTISTQEVGARAQRLESIADILGVRKPSWLTPDIGGALLYSRMRIFDLGMLCDARIARYLGESAPAHNVQAFHDYVFDEIQPTFISIRAYHTWISRMQGDPRFRRDYLALHEFTDDWIQARFGKAVTSGEYVRRSVVEASGQSFESIQRKWAKHPTPWER